MMTRFFSTLLAMVALPALAAVTITNDMREIQGGAFNSPVTFYPLQSWSSNGTYIVNGPAKTFTPRNGIITVTNIQFGSYAVVQNKSTNYIAVSTDLSGTYNLAQLSTNGLTIYSGTLGSGFPGVVKVTSTDTTPGVLGAKMVAGSGIALSTNTPSGDADLVITATGVPANPIDGYAVTNAPYLHILDGPFVLQSSGLDPVSITAGDETAEITGSLNVSATVRGASFTGNQSGITNDAGLTIAQQITQATNGLGSGSGDVTAAGDNVFTGTTNAFTGAVGIGTLNVNTQIVDVLEFSSLLGTLYGTNIAAGQIDTNHLTAAAYAALAGGGSITNPIDGYTITNAPSVTTTNLTVRGSATNVLGETEITGNFIVWSNLVVTGGTTNTIGYAIFTNGVSGDGSGWTGVNAATFTTTDDTNTYATTGFDPVYVSAGGDSELVVDGSINTGPWGVTSGSLTVNTNLTLTGGANPVLRVDAGSVNTLVVTNGMVGINTNNPQFALTVRMRTNTTDGVKFLTHDNLELFFVDRFGQMRWAAGALGTRYNSTYSAYAIHVPGFQYHLILESGTGGNAGTIKLLTTNVITSGSVTVGDTIAVASRTNEPSAIPGYAQIYAATNTGVTELYVQGDDGTETQISPHADDAPSTLYDLALGDVKEIVWREVNPFLTNGAVSFINMRRMARLTELNTRAILYLAGNNNSSLSNALVKLKDMSPAQRQVLMTETFQQYNTRTGRNLKPLVWEDVEQARQVAYDAERVMTLEAYDRILAENIAKEAAGDTNIVDLPTIPPDMDVRRPKPAWMN